MLSQNFLLDHFRCLKQLHFHAGSLADGYTSLAFLFDVSDTKDPLFNKEAQSGAKHTTEFRFCPVGFVFHRNNDRDSPPS